MRKKLKGDTTPVSITGYMQNGNLYNVCLDDKILKIKQHFKLFNATDTNLFKLSYLMPLIPLKMFNMANFMCFRYI